MGAFGIFVFVLTFAYVIYYAVVIFLDLTHKEKKSDDVMDIDVEDLSAIPDEPPTDVVETEDGGYFIRKEATLQDADGSYDEEEEGFGNGFGDNGEAERGAEEAETDAEGAEETDGTGETDGTNGTGGDYDAAGAEDNGTAGEQNDAAAGDAAGEDAAGGGGQERPLGTGAEVIEMLKQEMRPVPVTAEVEIDAESFAQLIVSGGITPAGEQIISNPIRL